MKPSPEPITGELQRRYPSRLTPYLEGLIERSPEVALQFMPDPRELREFDGLLDDPLAEDQHSPLPALVHRYPDRVLLLASSSCAATCRFCFRKGREFSSFEEISPEEREALFTYLESQKQVREVVLTGGDPLLLAPENLEELLERLVSLPQVETLRVHTRLPVVAPERVSTELLTLLRRFQPLYVILHVNHPHELTEAFARTCAQFADAGIPLGSQSVLLRGVNADVAVLESLFRGLLRLRVRPYYLHHPDVARGTGHFRVPIEEGIGLVRDLSRRLSALTLPRYVIDLPGGAGKLELTEQALVSAGVQAVLRGANGEWITVANRLE